MADTGERARLRPLRYRGDSMLQRLTRALVVVGIVLLVGIVLFFVVIGGVLST